MSEFENRDIKFVEIGINCFDIDDMIEVITKYKPCLGVVLGELPKFITKDTDVENIFGTPRGTQEFVVIDTETRNGMQ